MCTERSKSGVDRRMGVGSASLRSLNTAIARRMREMASVNGESTGSNDVGVPVQPSHLPSSASERASKQASKQVN
jgi:hypothetical protein